jgi:CRISPR-associated protein Cmr3
MTSHKLNIRPIDPLISRDSRSFGQGQGRKVRSLDWLTPLVVCGSLRSFLGKRRGYDFPQEVVDELKCIQFRGPFLELERGESEGELYFHRPLDFVADKEKGYAIRPPKNEPEKPRGGANMPEGLVPAFIQNTCEDFKPEPAPAFWSASAMTRWLENEDPCDFSLSWPEGISGPIRDERVHVRIDPETGASLDSFLFTTTGLDFRMKKDAKKKRGEILQLTIAVEATPPDAPVDYDEYLGELSSLHPLGGERRLAEWSRETPHAYGWNPPQMRMTESVSAIRMILATPAIFSNGWLPDWIAPEEMEGNIPGLDTNIRVKLVSAVTGRWEPISGWSYEKKSRGVKPLHRMVPAGSVYFFKILGESIDGAVLKELWLRSVCGGQYKNDGFGAALWGVW